MSKMLSERKIIEWVRVYLNKHDIKEYTVRDMETIAQDKGFSSDIIRVRVSLKSISNEGKTELDVILKAFKSLNSMGDRCNLDIFNLKEIFVYRHVFPKFREFEVERNITTVFHCVPKYFDVLVSGDNQEILVLENLNTQGYEVHDRKISMNFYHTKLVLKCFAKFHAISFAFKSQKKDEFEKLTANITSGYKTLLETKKGELLFGSFPDRVYEMVQNSNAQLAAKLKIDIMDKGTVKLMLELCNIKVEERVITHGDCWNNNFMFKYEDINKNKPIDVKFLDWQHSSLHSPMMDIAHFIFLSSSDEQFSNIDELLKYYYGHLSKCITELGSDAETIFPYSTMLDHWKQFSLLGLIYSMSVLPLALRDKIDTAGLDPMADLEQAYSGAMFKNELFKRRFFAALQYYFDLAK